MRIISGIITEPTDAVSATDEPEIAPKKVEARMFTSASPPRMKPTKILATLMSRAAMPPSAMMAPASTKNGMARRGKLSIPSEVLSITASSGRSIQSAARIEARPSA